MEGSSIISGGVLVIIVAAIAGYRSCYRNGLKSMIKTFNLSFSSLLIPPFLPLFSGKLAAKALARAVEAYRVEETQFLHELQAVRGGPAEPTVQPRVVIERPISVSLWVQVLTF